MGRFRDYAIDIGFPIGALPVRIQNVPYLLVFTNEGIAVVNYISWKVFLPAGVLLDMRELVKVAKGGPQVIEEFLSKAKKIEEFIPYSDVLEVSMERRFLNKVLVVVIRLRSGEEMVFRVVAGKGTGIGREEYVALFESVAREVLIKMVVSELIQ